MLERWETLERRTSADCKIFTVDAVRRRLTRADGASVEGDFFVLNSPAWVNIIPLTPRQTVVMVKQYRHGVGEITLEVPGGLVDAGEDPLQAAMRECLEETGYAGAAEAELLGTNFPNPAFLNNVCGSYLWRDCECVSAQGLDEHEDIEATEIPIAEIPSLIEQGVIRHSLVLVAFFFFWMREYKTRQGKLPFFL